MTRALKLGLLATIFAGFTASAEADVLRSVGRYAEDRGNDFLDIFRIRGGVARDGRGIGAKARVTTLAQVGYVYFDGTYAGLDRRGIGVVEERRREFGISALYGSYNEMEPLHGNEFLRANSEWSQIADRRILRNVPHWDDGRKRHLSLGAEIATPLIAVDLGLYPEEALDFVLGLFTIDIFKDDKARSYSIESRRLEPTTLPIPDGKAPFADKRERYAPIIEEMRIQREAAERDQRSGAQIITRDGRVLTYDEQDTPALEGAISEDEAQEALRQLDALQQETLPPSIEDAAQPEER